MSEDNFPSTVRQRAPGRSAVCLALAALLLGVVAPNLSEAAHASSCAAIQHKIDALPSAGGLVMLAPVTYQCAAPIVIDRDNVSLRGWGPATVLHLVDGGNAPVIVLGQTIDTPTITRRNLHVSDLHIDGNRENQTFECWGGDCSIHPIRNNGLTLRRVEDVVIERVSVRGARSGGLVTEHGCRRLTIQDFTAFDNHFDGLAGYLTEDSVFSRLYLHDNLAAGLSFDIRFNNNIISDSVIAGNGSVGIFMRDSFDNLFDALQIRNSGEHGIFLAQVDTDATKPAAGNAFVGVVVSGSQGAGIRVNDVSCVDNLLVGAQLIGNNGGCISEATPGLLESSGTVCR